MLQKVPPQLLPTTHRHRLQKKSGSDSFSHGRSHGSGSLSTSHATPSQGKSHIHVPSKHQPFTHSGSQQVSI